MRYGFLVSLAAATSLLALYASFAMVFVGADLLAGATTLELGIFFLQFFKVVAVASIKKLRNFPPVILIDIFGGELVFLLPGLVISYLYLGLQSAPSLMVQILLAWISGVGAFATPFATYRLAKAMIRGEILLGVLPSAIFLSELIILLVVGATKAAASGLGLPGLSRAVLLVGADVGTMGATVTGVTALIPLVILYMSLLLYALNPGETKKSSGVRSLLVLGLLATVVTYIGVYAVSWFALSLTYAVLPVALVTATVMWLVTREA